MVKGTVSSFFIHACALAKILENRLIEDPRVRDTINDSQLGIHVSAIQIDESGVRTHVSAT